MRRLALLTPLVAAAVLVAPNPALAMGNSKIAALQAALWQRGLYHGNVSGITNRATVRGVKRLQRSSGLVVDGIVGPKTRPFLGRLGAPALGSRTLRRGRVGGDVVELQYLLAEHGFPSARFDGAMGAHVVAALRRFQRYADLKVDGRTGPSTLAALAQPPPQAPTGVLDRPLAGPISSTSFMPVSISPSPVARRCGRRRPAAWFPPVRAETSGFWSWLRTVGNCVATTPISRASTSPPGRA
jgi:peptidoglycan hydrolase-like protein with peptidoglycan-binding domain